jgi:diguanylate cyclase (GGDEF)-like protein/PAS domain S-box-containing protein
MSPAAAARSAVAIVRPHWPAAVFVAVGIIVSLWAAGIGAHAVVVVLAGTALTALLVTPIVRMRPRSTGATAEHAAAIALTLLADQFESVPDGILVIIDDPLRVSVNRNLVRMLRLPADVAALDDAPALLAAVLARMRQPDRLQADMERLVRHPKTAIHREVEFADGSMFELNAGSMKQTTGVGYGLMRFFVFHDISARLRAERDVRRTSMLLQRQIDASPLGIVVDHAGIVTSLNRHFMETFQFDPPLGVGTAVHPSLLAFARKVRHADEYVARICYIYDHPSEDAVDEIVTNDGRIIERHTVDLRGDAGESLGRIWFFSDITELRGAARIAQDERNFASALLDSLPGYFVLIDGGGRLVRWNESLRLLNGLSDEEIMGSDPFANIVEGDREATIAEVRQTIVEGFGELEFGIHTASRGIRAIRWHGRRIMVDGQAQVLAVGIDVTDIRAAEALLRVSEERFRLIFESVSDGIVVQDAATQAFLDVNPRECEMLGYTREEFLALAPLDVTGGSRAEAVARLRELRVTAPVWGRPFEWVFRDKRGRDFWCEVARQYANFGGRDVFLLTIRDVSERKAAAAEVTYRDRILHALALSTAELVRAPSFAVSMPSLLEAVAQELDVDRILVIQRRALDAPSTDASVIFGWQRANVPQVDIATIAAQLPDPADRRALEAWLAPLLVGSPVITQAAGASGLVRRMMLAGQTLSSLLVPIFVGGAYWGHFAVDATERVREWTPVEIDALTTFADLVGALVTRQRTEASLQRSEEQFRAVSESVLDAIIMVGMDGRIRFWNPSAERIFGYSAVEADGQSLGDCLTPHRSGDEAKRGMADFIAIGTGPLLGRTLEFPATRKDGVEIEIELTINAMNVGADRYVVGVARDITERKRERVEIEKMASHDALTGLPNRRLFIEALDAAIRRASRSGQLFAVLSLDMDRFKDVNDTIGHPAGDRLLQQVAERLSASVRDIDTVARFGGDEFAAIQMDIRDPADAAVLAQKLVRLLDEPFVVDGNQIHSGTSIGIAVHGPDSPDGEALLAHADVALYRAKADGRGTYRFYNGTMDADVRARVTLDHELRAGIALNQFFLLYQPQVDVEGRIVGVEALVRWHHPTRGVVQPAAFIPAAERSGLINPLGTWIFRAACRQTASWIAAGTPIPRLSVNLSALQFKAPLELEKSITAITADLDVAANRIELELTASALMEASQQHNDVLMRLRVFGFRIAIDDFGNGYSSLDYLRRFPVDRIKIPQNFIDDLGVLSEDAPIVRAIIGLARELDITVLAKGVENVRQFELLRAWGCQEMQGFYFAKPLPPDEIAALLRSGTIAPAT